jgi:hypothetical protein
MKYALLIYSPQSDWDHLSEEERAAINAEYMAINTDERVTGGAHLQGIDTATTVRVNGTGEALLTDGPFVSAKEYLGGMFILEAADLDEATAMAARIPVARMGGAVEVRPLVER